MRSEVGDKFKLSPLCTTKNTFAPAFPDGSISCARYLANLAFSRPKWYSVAVEKRERRERKKEKIIYNLTFTFHNSDTYYSRVVQEVMDVKIEKCGKIV